MEMQKEDQPLRELLGELVQDVRSLVRDEIELARAEMTQRAKDTGKDVAYLLVGAAVAYAGLLVLLAAIVLILAYGMLWWIAALIVGIVVAGIGYFLVQKGISDLKARSFVPRQTIESLKRDKELVKEKIT